MQPRSIARLSNHQKTLIPLIQFMNLQSLAAVLGDQLEKEVLRSIQLDQIILLFKNAALLVEARLLVYAVVQRKLLRLLHMAQVT